MRLINNYEAVIHITFIPEGDARGTYHAHVTGERLTMCGREFPLFTQRVEDVPYNKELCDRCANVIQMIKRYHVNRED